MVQSLSEYSDLTVAGNGIEVDGNFTLPYGRLQHATVGGVKKTTLTQNAFLDESGRDDSTKSSWQAGFHITDAAESFKISRAASGGSLTWADLLTLSSAGVVFIANGTPPGTPTGGVYIYAENGALKARGSGGTVTTLAPA
jgi:hypothetical protein